jgi:hypothetical protein
VETEQLRLWLLIQPRPTKVVAIDANEQVHELDIKKTMTWKSVADSLLALDPVKLQAFEGDKLLRATKPGELEPEEDDEEGQLVVQDPESQRLIVFAKLLAEGYKHANGVAFQTLSGRNRSRAHFAQPSKS